MEAGVGVEGCLPITKRGTSIPILRKLLFVSFSAVLVLVFIELVSAGVLWFKTGSLGSPIAVGLLADQVAEAGGASPLADASIETLHPYLGFTLDPDRETEDLTRAHKGVPISDWGFLDTASPIRKRRPDTLVVGIFGGSVAFWLSALSVETLAARLHEVPEFAGREISIVRVALGGYKQPQQLLAFTYLLSLGAEFDVVINLDGFNEIVLAPADNLSSDTFPLYPRFWRQRIEPSPTHQSLVLMGSLATLRGHRVQRAEFMGRPPLRWSMTANLLWLLSDERLQSEMASLQAELAQAASGQTDREPYRTRGPERSYDTRKDMYQDLASAWSAASLQMHRLAVSNGTRYWHFLQPNQYVRGSKPIGKAERKVAINLQSPYVKHVEGGYGYLRRSGRELPDSGVHYHDLTQVFADESQPLYSDDCCHLNQIGSDILADAVGEWIVRDLAAAVSGTPGAPR